MINHTTEVYLYNVLIFEIEKRFHKVPMCIGLLLRANGAYLQVSGRGCAGRFHADMHPAGGCQPELLPVVGLQHDM